MPGPTRRPTPGNRAPDSRGAPPVAPNDRAPAPLPKPKVAIKSPTQLVLGTKNTGTNAFGTPTAINWKGLQQQLVKAGYKIKVDGIPGPQTLSALRDYYGQPNEPLTKLKTQLTDPKFVSGAGGVGHPGAWDKTHVDVAAPYAPAKVGKGGQPAPGMSTAGYSDASGGTVNLDPAHKALPMGKLVPLGYAKFGSMIDPNTANDIAGAQFDPQIAMAQLAVNEDPLQSAQNLKDIGSWYGQVGAAEQHAAANDKAMTAAGTGSIGDSAAALLASLGGGANQGGTSVGEVGQADVGTMAALGAATNDYMSQIAPLLQAEGADQKVRQSRLDAKQLLSDRTQLASLQSSKGEAANAARAQIEQQNNALAQARAQMADQILGQNNSTRQQGFSNQMALTNAQIAAEMSGLKVADTQARDSKYTNPSGFVYASPGARLAAQQTAIQTLQGLAKKGVKITPQLARQTIAGIYQGNGWDPASPAVQQAMNGVYNTWVAGSGGV